MLFTEASRMSVELEKKANYTGKTARATKNNFFASQKIKEILKKMSNGENVSKDVLSLSKKNKKGIENIKDMTDNKHKTPINRVRKRFLQLLRRNK